MVFEILDDEIVPFDSAGNPLVFLAGRYCYCAKCAPGLYALGVVLAVGAVALGLVDCDGCGEIVGHEDADAEVASSEDDCAFSVVRLGRGGRYIKADGQPLSTSMAECAFDPTDADWELDCNGREGDDCDAEDEGDREDDDPGEDSPPPVQLSPLATLVEGCGDV